jgi:glycosyltransferase involved in cell wall biosynthesis
VHILSFSTLFPNKNQPHHGIFVKNRLEHLKSSYPDITLRMIAPVPYYPNLGIKKYKHYINIPYHEIVDTIETYHPRYIVIPKIGMNITPYTLYSAGLKAVKNYIKHYGKPDILDSHYVYPDGIAATWIGEKLNIPTTMTARGTDINLIPHYRFPKKLILNAIDKCDAIITVCAALKDEIIHLGGDKNKIHTMRNGVDLIGFTPCDKNTSKQKYNLPLDKKIIVSVGHLIERKGHHLIIEALKLLDENIHLAIAGSGELEQDLKQQVVANHLQNRVHFLGALPHYDLKYVYSAANCMVLASSREGWPNVLLESMACDTPVVATKVWGSPEVVQNNHAGILIDERNSQSIAKGIEQLFSSMPVKGTTRIYAEQFSWDTTSKAQYELFNNLCKRLT